MHASLHAPSTAAPCCSLPVSPCAARSRRIRLSQHQSTQVSAASGPQSSALRLGLGISAPGLVQQQRRRSDSVTVAAFDRGVPPRFGMPPRNTEAPPPGLYTPDWAPDRTQICTPVTATTTLGVPALTRLCTCYHHHPAYKASRSVGLFSVTDA